MKLALITSTHPLAESLGRRWAAVHPFVQPCDADIIVVAGGDGMMLRAMREFPDKHFYGMNCGSVGFLLNTFHGEDWDVIFERIEQSKPILLRPLALTLHTLEGMTHHAFAINEVALMRRSPQGAKIAITVDGRKRLDELVCDGVLVATPAGSTAYNFSAHGPIIPLGAPLLALTPICPFRPRRWRGALLPDTAHIIFDVIEPEHRRVNASFDDQELTDITRVYVVQDQTRSFTLLCDPDHHLEERIIAEQFFA